MAAVDIIIPYFQRRPGVLKKAVTSVFAQDFDDFRLIIVDDGSPSPVDPELDELTQAQREKLHIVRQPNGGVAAARAAGLRAVSANTEAVLFLDSDDQWQPGHLRRAYDSIKAGADIYWCAVKTDDTFDTDSRPLDMIAAASRSDFPVAGVEEIQNFGRVLIGHWWRHLHLSATAFSGDVARKTSIRETLRITEDFAFYLDAWSNAARFAASNTSGVMRGTGENIWHGVTFEQRRFSVEKFNSAMLLREFRSEPRLTGQDRSAVDARVNRYRSLFFWSQVSRMKIGKKPMLKHWFKWIARDPGMLGFTLARLAKRPDPYADKSDLIGDSV